MQWPLLSGVPADDLRQVLAIARRRTFGAGDTFGELALVGEGAARSATVGALEAAETWSILRDDFAQLVRRYPGVNSVLVAILAEQVRRANDRMIEAYYVDADTRVRRRLLE